MDYQQNFGAVSEETADNKYSIGGNRNFFAIISEESDRIWWQHNLCLKDIKGGLCTSVCKEKGMCSNWAEMRITVERLILFHTFHRFIHRGAALWIKEAGIQNG